MKVSDLYGNEAKYIKSADLEGREHEVLIDHVEYADLDGSRKTVLYFQGRDKGLVLNQTNAVTLELSWSCSEQDDWVGGTIAIYVAPTTYKGAATVGIRVRAIGPLPPRLVVTPATEIQRAADRF